VREEVGKSAAHRAAAVRRWRVRCGLVQRRLRRANDDSTALLGAGGRHFLRQQVRPRGLARYLHASVVVHRLDQGQHPTVKATGTKDDLNSSKTIGLAK
uniref:Uncharacterized protein n=1 Tax=Anopheles atroparvus TaxID=41427 RepID=A0AAG5CPE8_ANOAO